MGWKIYTIVIYYKGIQTNSTYRSLKMFDQDHSWGGGASFLRGEGGENVHL